LQNNGGILIGTATCLQEAILLSDKGIDIITAQGIEAGGHRGTFLELKNLPMIGSIALIREVVNAVKNPVIAAGGIADGRSIKAAFILGASGVQMGSAFIACNESTASETYRSCLQNSRDTDSVLTKSITGRWARAIQNELIDTIESSQLKIPPYPFQIALTSPLREYGQKQNNK
jgi:nitronate monooxygenase